MPVGLEPMTNGAAAYSNYILSVTTTSQMGESYQVGSRLLRYNSLSEEKGGKTILQIIFGHKGKNFRA